METYGTLTTTNSIGQIQSGEPVPLTSGMTWYWQSNWYPYPYQAYWYPWPTEPTNCVGKAHVFECDHVDACKCGVIKREMGKGKGGKRPKC